MFLGQISYAVYLLHIPLLTLCALAGFSAYTHPVAFLAGLLLLSAATYLFLEEPARQWIRKTSDRPPSS
jgi:peptidoglycan/LPS O-acetylase OafA/YrhL